MQYGENYFEEKYPKEWTPVKIFKLSVLIMFGSILF